MPAFIHHLTPADWLALGLFMVIWVGYAIFAEHSRAAPRGLVLQAHSYRLAWARQLLAREARVADAALIGNLMNSVSFYANTTIYIIAGLFAVLGTLDKLVSITADLPFSGASSRDMLEIKLLLLFGVFVVAYFKFTWSLRQFNILSILVGAAPRGNCADDGELEAFAHRLAVVNSLAGDDFNRGIRAYYFGLAALNWLISPWLFMVVTALIAGVLYRRDFASPALAALVPRSTPGKSGEGYGD